MQPFHVGEKASRCEGRISDGQRLTERLTERLTDRLSECSDDEDKREPTRMCLLPPVSRDAWCDSEVRARISSGRFSSSTGTSNTRLSGRSIGGDWSETSGRISAGRYSSGAEAESSNFNSGAIEERPDPLAQDVLPSPLSHQRYNSSVARTRALRLTTTLMARRAAEGEKNRGDFHAQSLTGEEIPMGSGFVHVRLPPPAAPGETASTLDSDSPSCLPTTRRSMILKKPAILLPKNLDPVPVAPVYFESAESLDAPREFCSEGHHRRVPRGRPDLGLDENFDRTCPEIASPRLPAQERKHRNFRRYFTTPSDGATSGSRPQLVKPPARPTLTAPGGLACDRVGDCDDSDQESGSKESGSIEERATAESWEGSSDSGSRLAWKASGSQPLDLWSDPDDRSAFRISPITKEESSSLKGKAGFVPEPPSARAPPKHFKRLRDLFLASAASSSSGLDNPELALGATGVRGGIQDPLAPAAAFHESSEEANESRSDGD